MTVVAKDQIPNLLGHLGGAVRRIDDCTWRCTMPASSGSTRLVVRHGGNWLYLAVVPFLDPQAIRPWGGGKYPQGFLGRLLAVNRNLSMVKFALDEDGDIVLRSELPTESLQASEVEMAAQTLLRTTEQYEAPIREALLDAGARASQPIQDDDFPGA